MKSEGTKGNINPKFVTVIKRRAPTFEQVSNALDRVLTADISIAELKRKASMLLSCSQNIFDEPTYKAIFCKKMKLTKSGKRKRNSAIASPIAMSKSILNLQKNQESKLNLQRKRKLQSTVQPPRKKARIVQSEIGSFTPSTATIRVVPKFFSKDWSKIARQEFAEIHSRILAECEQEVAVYKTLFMEVEAIPTFQELEDCVEELVKRTSQPASQKGIGEGHEPTTRILPDEQAFNINTAKRQQTGQIHIDNKVASKVNVKRNDELPQERLQLLSQEIVDESCERTSKEHLGILVFEDPVGDLAEEKDESESSSQGKSPEASSEKKALIIQKDQFDPSSEKQAKLKSPLTQNQKLIKLQESKNSPNLRRNLTPTRESGTKFLSVPFGSLNPQASPVMYSSPPTSKLVLKPNTPKTTPRVAKPVETPATAPRKLKSVISKKKKQDFSERTPRRVKFTLPVGGPFGGRMYSEAKKRRKKKEPRAFSEEELAERLRKHELARENKKRLEAERAKQARYNSPLGFQSPKNNSFWKRAAKMGRLSPRNDLMQTRAKQKFQQRRAREAHLAKSLQSQEFPMERKEAEFYHRRGQQFLKRVLAVGN